MRMHIILPITRLHQLHFEYRHIGSYLDESVPCSLFSNTRLCCFSVVGESETKKQHEQQHGQQQHGQQHNEHDEQQQDQQHEQQ